MNYCIAGIHTGIGKTICSAIICEALGFDYWKPVQAGDLDQSDSITVKGLLTNTNCYIHEERYKLKTAASPHYAAELEQLTIRIKDFEIPLANNPIIIETAGGVMSPLAANLFNIDLLAHFNLPVILVSQNYLGSINHTLLTVAALKQKNIPITGLVFVGDPTPSTEKIILETTGLPLLFSVPIFENLSAENLKLYASSINIQHLKND